MVRCLISAVSQHIMLPCQICDWPICCPMFGLGWRSQSPLLRDSAERQADFARCDNLWHISCSCAFCRAAISAAQLWASLPSPSKTIGSHSFVENPDENCTDVKRLSDTSGATGIKQGCPWTPNWLWRAEEGERQRECRSSICWNHLQGPQMPFLFWPLWFAGIPRHGTEAIVISCMEVTVSQLSCCHRSKISFSDRKPVFSARFLVVEVPYDRMVIPSLLILVVCHWLFLRFVRLQQNFTSLIHCGNASLNSQWFLTCLSGIGPLTARNFDGRGIDPRNHCHQIPHVQSLPSYWLPSTTTVLHPRIPLLRSRTGRHTSVLKSKASFHKYLLSRPSGRFRMEMLTEKVMHECVKKLLGNHEYSEEEEIESSASSFATIGSILL